MKLIALFLIMLSVSSASLACKTFLVGTWQSDAAATMSFNRANARLEERQDRFLTSLFGKMTLKFTDKQLHLRMPDTEVLVKGEVKPFAGFEERTPYKLLHCNERMVVVKSTEAVTGEESVTTYFIVDPDGMWVYAGTNSPRVPDLHTREYFKRLR